MKFGREERLGRAVICAVTGGNDVKNPKAIRPNWRLVRILVDHGANVNVLDKQGRSLLFHACRNGDGEAIHWLLKDEVVALKLDLPRAIMMADSSPKPPHPHNGEHSRKAAFGALTAAALFAPFPQQDIYGLLLNHEPARLALQQHGECGRALVAAGEAKRFNAVRALVRAFAERDNKDMEDTRDTSIAGQDELILSSLLTTTTQVPATTPMQTTEKPPGFVSRDPSPRSENEKEEAIPWKKRKVSDDFGNPEVRH